MLDWIDKGATIYNLVLLLAAGGGGAGVSAFLHRYIPAEYLWAVGLVATAVLLAFFLWLVPKIYKSERQDEPSMSRRSKLFWIVVLFAAGFLVGRWLNKRPMSYDENTKLELVNGRSFHNQIVPLDGHEYMGCTFENVTFLYNGTSNLSFSRNHIVGSVWFKTENRSISGALGALRGLGLISPSIPLYDEKGKPLNVEPPTRTPSSVTQQ